MKNLTVILCCVILSVSSIQAQFMDSKAEKRATTDNTSNMPWHGGRTAEQNLTTFTVEILDQAQGLVTTFETSNVEEDIQNADLPSGLYTVIVSSEGILVYREEMRK